MPIDLAVRLRQTINRELPHLHTLSAEQSALREAGKPDAWSPRQELGHLIDSAANNHLRFVGAATQEEFHGSGYAQNAWVDLHGYQEQPWASIVGFWSQYNFFLADLIERLPAAQMNKPCHIGNSAPVSLGYLIADYILHMQHHLDHLLHRDVVTAYPAVPEPPRSGAA
jgi:hypothetical protein